MHKRKDHLVLVLAAVLLIVMAVIGYIARHGAGRGHLDQTHYRWRNDDGDKLVATWAAPEDQSVKDLPLDTTIRLRMQVANTGTSTAHFVRFRLEYATSTEDDGWLPLGNAGTRDEHWALSYSPHVIDGISTTNLPDGISDPSASSGQALRFIAGEMKDWENRTSPITLPAGSFTELEFSVRATDQALREAVYYFRIAREPESTADILPGIITSLVRFEPPRPENFRMK